MVLLDFIAYLVMLVLAIALLGLIILGVSICGTFVVGFLGGLFNELKKPFLKKI